MRLPGPTVRKLIIALIALLSTPAHVLAAAAEVRTSTGAWVTVCRPGGGYCTASARLPAHGTGATYEYLLRVSRAAPEAVPEIAILIAGSRPRADAPITVQVDRETPLELAAGSGYRALALGGTYILGATAAAALLDQLRKGKQVEFRYDTRDGTPVTKSFSLAGFSGALTFLERTQGSALPVTPVKVASTPAPIAPAAPPVVPPIETAPVVAVDPQRVNPEPPPTPSTAEALPNPVPLPPPPEPKKPTAAATRTAQSPPLIPGRRRVAKLIRQFTCRASDPFWNLSIDNSNARLVSLSGSGEPQAVVLAGKLGITGEGRTPDVDWRGKSDTGASYRALINETRCVDSAADKDAQTQYDYRVQITMPGGKTLRGCCNAGLDTEGPKPAAGIDNSLPVADLNSKAADDWTRLLLDLLPAMQACLDKTPGPSAYVTKAWPMNRGMVGTRTRNRDGGWFECTATSDGQSVEHIEMLPKAAAPLPGEQSAVFTSSAQTPPSGNCYRTERVQDAAGKWVGWLSSNGC
jgi:hypothetical protein